MKWNYKDLINWIENGCDKLIGDTITELYVNYNNLTTLPIISFPLFILFKNTPNNVKYKITTNGLDIFVIKFVIIFDLELIPISNSAIYEYSI